MHGIPLYPVDFQHFSYVNPQAPRGGRLTLGLLGSFDSLNPFIVRGLAVQQLRGHVFESLMVRGYDEPFTLYPLVAQGIETDAARRFVTFHLDPRARFSDNTPITAADILFSWRILRDQGRPNHRQYYAKVADARILDSRVIRFDLAEGQDHELPLILGLMPVLPSHAIRPEEFDTTSLLPPLGSGAYRVDDVRPGEQVILQRNPDHWARDLPVSRGFWNFDEIHLDWYRDAATLFEAFRKGVVDIRAESDPGRWVQGYAIAPREKSRVVQEEFTSAQPAGMRALVFNTRRSLFADRRVRQALALLFDFEWLNRTYFHGRWRRCESYFNNSELSALGRAADASEEALLPQDAALDADIRGGTWRAPRSDGSGRDRAQLRQALDLLAKAGWQLKGGRLQKPDGSELAFEIMVHSRDQERTALAYSGWLTRAGGRAQVRRVDPVQYEARRQNFDYDMIEAEWGVSLSPGNELAYYWSSQAAQEPGSRNYMGLADPFVDRAITRVIAVEERRDLVSAVRALDRLLINGHWVVPLHYAPQQWVARWSHIGRPRQTSQFGYLPETWWRESP